jgi:uncharacterized membrane protein YukC
MKMEVKNKMKIKMKYNKKYTDIKYDNNLSNDERIIRINKLEEELEEAVEEKLNYN